MEGFIKLHRCFLEWEWFDDSDIIKTFLYLILKANFKDKKWKGINIKQGSLIISRGGLAEKIGITESKIRTILKKLQDTREIKIQTTNRYSMITIVNWDKYQGGVQTATTLEPDISKKETTGKKRLQVQSGMEEKPPTQSKATGLDVEEMYNKLAQEKAKKSNRFVKPTVEEIDHYILNNNYNVNANKFYDFYESKGWVVGKNNMKCWKASVRTWNGNNKEKTTESKKTETLLDIVIRQEEEKKQQEMRNVN